VGAGAVMMVGACGRRSAPSAVEQQRILVVVEVNGGNDWLNMMPPREGLNREIYDSVRQDFAIPVEGTTDLGSGVGLNTDFTGMDALSAAGKVAWIAGVGMNNPNLSHFISMALWAQGSATPNGTGWLGRLADGFDPHGDALRGLTVATNVPLILRGASRTFTSITSSSGYVYPSWLRANQIGAPWDAPLLESGFSTAVGARSSDPVSADGYATGAALGQLFLDGTHQYGTNGSLPSRASPVLYPGDDGYTVTRVDGTPLATTLSSQLKLIAQMIAAGLPTQVYYCRLPGWDTHVSQKLLHPNLMRTLGGSLSAFYQDLARIPGPAGATAQDRVLLVAFSEFGRRVKPNGSGTDHGTAGLSICVGNAVKGGLYGDYPSLADLDANGNLKYAVDYRSLYATVLERWMGHTPDDTDRLLGAPYPRLGFL
jgi:uncharacterized protein (DUF1501 family)